jgi:hypothetical protein
MGSDQMDVDEVDTVEPASDSFLQSQLEAIKAFMESETTTVDELLTAKRQVADYDRFQALLQELEAPLQ